MIIGWTITGQGGAYLGEYEGMEVCVCVVLKKTGENKIEVLVFSDSFIYASVTY